ncbi:uncharacterized protein B0T15DRAFT_136895 [Chaetomium strumarium]|uniref:Uncharacterized protein n=1 Tax=Chaetomium strumarium TaxID=1170767 RepID=A0AAJ0GUW3_9PEZI|nr:hypothetical protein B0T15DRAFT_136895 [Chaetomium strumarium]
MPLSASFLRRTNSSPKWRPSMVVLYAYTASARIDGSSGISSRPAANCSTGKKTNWLASACHTMKIKRRLTIRDPVKATLQLAVQPLLELLHGRVLGVLERRLHRLRCRLGDGRDRRRLDVAHARRAALHCRARRNLDLAARPDSRPSAALAGLGCRGRHERGGR